MFILYTLILNHAFVSFQPIRIRHGQVFDHFEVYVPGAYHHARFMGKSIYLLKIFLLHQAFPLTNREIQRITRLVGFVVQLYGRYFLSAPLTTSAPRHDLTMWYDLQQYSQHDQEIGQSALASMRRHLWYLCPELVVLALFDEHTDIEEKQLMATTLFHTEKPPVFGMGKPGHPNFDPVAAKLTDDQPPLATFISERSWLLFSLLESDPEWLQEHPAIWPDYEDYQFCRDFCTDMMVVNDPAERAVKDVQDCAQMTRDPRHRDNVILVRGDHRGRVARLRKADLHNV